MTAARRSAYPTSVQDLLPRARRLVADLDAVPSRNRLMQEYRIGASKAKALLAALATPAETATAAAEQSAAPADDRTDPAGQPGTTGDGNGQDEVVPRLHAVPPDSGGEEEEGQVPEAATAVPSPDPGTGGPTADLAPVAPAPRATAAPPASLVAAVVDPGAPAVAGRAGRVSRWPLLLLAAPAFVAVWSGWVGLGELAGFGVVHPAPGIADRFAINSAITLPVGVETYAAYALRAWLAGPVRARRFARWSTVAALGLGAAGQVTYHLLSAAGVRAAPWPITTVVACLPVAVLGMGAALAHLLHTDTDATEAPPAGGGGR